MSADGDLVTLESQLQLYRSLRHGELAIVPGTSHTLLLLEKPRLSLTLTRQCLEESPVDTMIPIRRA